jgi:hypothetical protein
LGAYDSPLSRVNGLPNRILFIDDSANYQAYSQSLQEQFHDIGAGGSFRAAVPVIKIGLREFTNILKPGWNL